MLRSFVNAMGAVVLAMMSLAAGANAQDPSQARSAVAAHPILEKTARRFRSRQKVLRRIGADRELLNIINNQ